jgi:rod shape determining protein RodA
MRSIINFFSKDLTLTLSVVFTVIFSVAILNSLDSTLFPQYLAYIFVALLFFVIFSMIGFDIVSLFSKHLYIGSVLLLAATLIIGSVTRNTVRWIQLGSSTFQPAEIVRPFLLLFFANYLGKGEVDLKKFGKALLLLAIPVILILIQPSLGVSVLTVVGYIGVLLASKFNKKYLIVGILLCIAIAPLAWNFLAPYQKERLTTFLDPTSDPKGAGYNSIQATIAAGSGKIFGTGLGKGVQTQLAFLPEKQTDFIFASTAEELGLLGVGFVLLASFLILLRLVHYIENSVSPVARAYLAGFFLTYLVQIFIHAGMNMGMLPITGLPFPLLSAGGSSLLATMIGLGIALGAYKK